MSDATTDGAHNPHPQPLQVELYESRHLVRIVASAVAAALGIGYLLNDLGDDVMGGLNGIARVLAAVAGTAVLLSLSAAGRDRRLSAIEARLDIRLRDAARAEGYLQGVEATLAKMADPPLRSVR